MIVILDTNIVMSAIFFSRTLTPIISHWASGSFKLALTKDIAEEYVDVYQRMSAKYVALMEQTFQTILASAEYFEPTKLNKQICKDADDDIFLECALSAKADFVVTGDKLLLAVGKIGLSEIIEARKFIDLLNNHPVKA